MLGHGNAMPQNQTKLTFDIDFSSLNDLFYYMRIK